MIKRLAALAFILMLACGARAQSAYVVRTEDFAALVDADGEGLVADTVFALREDALYAVGSPGCYCLYDAEGTRLNAENYEMLQAVGEVLLFRQGGRCGAMDMNGGLLIQAEWTQLTWAGDGAFLALEGNPYDDQPDEMIRLTTDGQRQSTGAFTADGLSAFFDGRMAYMISDGQYGYVDAEGRQVIPPEWRGAGDFADGAAIVSDDGGMGLIDTEGQVIVAPEYRWIQRGDGVIAALTHDGRLDVYATEGREKLFTADMPVEEAAVCGGYVMAKDADAARLYARDGALICTASRAARFDPGLEGQAIVTDGAWGEACAWLVNSDGSAASGKYQRLLPLRGGRYAFMTFTGDPYEGEDGAAIDWDYASVRWGLMDGEGRELLPPEYDGIAPAGDNRLTLRAGDRVIFADLDGNPLRTWTVTETAAPSSEAGA